MAYINTIQVTVNYNILKQLHPTFLLKATYLEAKQVSLENVDEELTFQYLPLSSKQLLSELRFILETVYGLHNWKFHLDHLLTITHLFINEELVNHDFEQIRKNQLAKIADEILQLKELALMVKSNKNANITLNYKHISIDVALINHKLINFAMDELLSLYNANRFDGGPHKKLDEFKPIKKQPGRTVTEYDKAIGHLALLLNVYLEEVSEIKSKSKLNFKNQEVTIGLSNKQGEFIYNYLTLFSFFEHNETSSHITVRRYIEKYIESLNSNPSVTK